MGTNEASKKGQPADWPRFLRGDDAQEILGRLSDSDPLRLRERAARRLRDLWLLLEPDRVYYRALAVCARAVAIENAPDDLDSWVTAKVDAAIDQLVCADLEAERMQKQPLFEEERGFALLTSSMMRDPGVIRSASVAFNSLAPRQRQAFYEVIIEGQDVDSLLQSWDEDELYNAIQISLKPFGLDVEPAPIAADLSVQPEPKEVPSAPPVPDTELRYLIEEVMADPTAGLTVPGLESLLGIASVEAASSGMNAQSRAAYHLLEAHREALAEWLSEASSIAYFMNQGLSKWSYRSSCPRLGRRSISKGGRIFCSSKISGLDLLRDCLERPEPSHALALAYASFCLVPSDKARLIAISCIPWHESKTVVPLLERFIHCSGNGGQIINAFTVLAARVCWLGELHKAREAYLKAIELAPERAYSRFGVLNLSCHLGDERTAEQEARELNRLLTAEEDVRLTEACEIVRLWSGTRPRSERKSTRHIAERIAGRIGGPASVLCSAIAS